MPTKPLKVTPKSAAPVEHITTNIKTNMELIPNWLERCAPHNNFAYICSAGPSLEPFLKKVSETPEKYYGATFFCVKHSLPLFKKYGIVPQFCSVLDPRSIDEVSTIGVKRQSLYADADPKTVFIVASMTDPSVTKWLMDNNKKLVGYHTATPEIKNLDKETRQKIGNFIITGGTSSATRSIELSFWMGFNSAVLVGFDSSYESPRPTNIVDNEGKQLYLKVKVDGENYYTSGEFIAQAQDIQNLLKNPRCFSNITLEEGLPTSLVHAIERKVGNLATSTKLWEDYLNV